MLTLYINHRSCIPIEGSNGIEQQALSFEGNNIGKKFAFAHRVDIIGEWRNSSTHS